MHEKKQATYLMELPEINHPDENLIQFTFFGPGYGESILIHLGNRNWVIIDSCVIDGQLVAKTYLNKIGVNIEKEVKLIVETHWDDDHIKGMSNLVEECNAAEFALPLVFSEMDFISYLIARNVLPNSNQKFGANELLKCFKIMKKKEKVCVFTAQNQILLRKQANSFSHRKSVELLALSPSNYQMQQFIDTGCRN